MRKNGDLAEPGEAITAFSGPDYLRAVFSLKQYSSMQGWGARRPKVRTPRHLSAACSCRAGAHAQAAE